MNAPCLNPRVQEAVGQATSSPAAGPGQADKGKSVKGTGTLVTAPDQPLASPAGWGGEHMH